VADPSELLDAFQRDLRARPDKVRPQGVEADRDGPLLRTVGWSDRGFVEYRDLGGLEGAALDELIERQVRFFAARDVRFEWKLYGHDRPADLPDRLRAHGFVPEPQETVLIAGVEDVAADPVLPPGVTLRELREPADLARLDDWERAAWAGREVHVADMLGRLLAAEPDAAAVVAAEAGETVVCANWIRFEDGTAFATLWGGATVPEWRRRGIYRATVAYRARLAAARGLEYLQVDASDDSRPILERLGFVAVTTTTPYIWSPAG
jgi:hypothetical protein